MFKRDLKVIEVGLLTDGTVQYQDVNGQYYYRDTHGDIFDSLPSDPNATGENVNLIVVPDFDSNTAIIA